MSVALSPICISYQSILYIYARRESDKEFMLFFLKDFFISPANCKFCLASLLVDCILLILPKLYGWRLTLRNEVCDNFIVIRWARARRASTDAASRMRGAARRGICGRLSSVSVSEKGAGLSGPLVEDHYELELPWLPWLRTGGRSRSRKCKGKP